MTIFGYVVLGLIVLSFVLLPIIRKPLPWWMNSVWIGLAIIWIAIAIFS